MSEFKIAELESELTVAKSSIHTLRVFVEQGRTERDLLYAKIDDLEKKLAIADGENQRLRAEISDKENRHRSQAVPKVPTASVNNTSQEFELEKRIAELRILSERNEFLTEKLRASLVEKDSMQTQIKVQRSKTSEFQKRVEELEKIHEDFQKSNKVDAITKKYEKIADKLRKSLIEKNEEIQALNGKLEIANSQIGKITDEIEKTRAEKESVSCKIRDTEENVVELSTKLERANLQIKEIISSHDIEIKVKQNLIEQLSAEIGKKISSENKFVKDVSSFVEQEFLLINQICVDSQTPVEWSVKHKLNEIKLVLDKMEPIHCSKCKQTAKKGKSGSGDALVCLLPCNHIYCEACLNTEKEDSLKLQGVMCAPCGGLYSTYSLKLPLLNKISANLEKLERLLIN
jgi:chromosome segregation ATPase